MTGKSPTKKPKILKPKIITPKLIKPKVEASETPTKVKEVKIPTDIANSNLPKIQIVNAVPLKYPGYQILTSFSLPLQSQQNILVPVNQPLAQPVLQPVNQPVPQKKSKTKSQQVPRKIALPKLLPKKPQEPVEKISRKGTKFEVPCDICGNKFASNFSLFRHKREKHGKTEDDAITFIRTDPDENRNQDETNTGA